MKLVLITYILLQWRYLIHTPVQTRTSCTLMFFLREDFVVIYKSARIYLFFPRERCGISLLLKMRTRFGPCFIRFEIYFHGLTYFVSYNPPCVYYDWVEGRVSKILGILSGDVSMSGLKICLHLSCFKLILVWKYSFTLASNVT